MQNGKRTKFLLEKLLSNRAEGDELCEIIEKIPELANEAASLLLAKNPSEYYLSFILTRILSIAPVFKQAEELLFARGVISDEILIELMQFPKSNQGGWLVEQPKVWFFYFSKSKKSRYLQ